MSTQSPQLLSIVALVLPHFMYCIKTYSTVSKYNALNTLVCNHSECLAIAVYVSMRVLSVEMEAVVF